MPREVRCWAHTQATREPCGRAVAPRPGEGDDCVPYCSAHLCSGDGNLRVVASAEFGRLLLARRALPRGYRVAYWGDRTRCPLVGDEDRCLLFDKVTSQCIRLNQ